MRLGCADYRGDALLLSDRMLDYLLNRLYQTEHVKLFAWAPEPITLPQRITRAV